MYSLLALIPALAAFTTALVTGPYVDDNKEPFICPQSEGGAIDPSGFLNESDNPRWITYKVDGNPIGHGGSCNNGVAPVVSTPIMLQQVSASDGHTLISSPVSVFDTGKSIHLIERAGMPSYSCNFTHHACYWSSTSRCHRRVTSHDCCASA
ncbi:hypothetical protein EJ03DRAFT_223380 [Teratosphaeria nubilosa]|uniref:Uncharacterized protein n=1 Tax=Teratosphaeria nubilosa TaxID=161662 RepID=A0A6G1KX74_9PEZI|nr:hypothetical protein EJ03DRAFT_223380 [Teratosphaeria nubilosa]